MTEEKPERFSPFPDGITPPAFIKLANEYIEDPEVSSLFKEWLTEEIIRAKDHSLFSTLQCIFKDKKLFLRWNTHFSFDINEDPDGIPDEDLNSR